MTISKILEKLSAKISATIQTLYTVAVEIEMTNIATVNDGDEFLLNKSALLLSIVNIEEDKTLRNRSH